MHTSGTLKPVWKKASGQPKQHTVMEWHAVSCDQKRQIVTNYLFYGMVTIFHTSHPYTCCRAKYQSWQH